jgi:F0F1-type ATP synthase delta subunit
VQELITALKTKEGLTEMQLTEAVDETLIGGFVLEYSGKMLDTSIKRKLHELKSVVEDDSYMKKYS